MSDSLSSGKKFVSGFMLIFFTALAAIMLIGYWPDRLPTSDSKCDMYTFRMFNVRLMDSADCCKPPAKDSRTLGDTTKIVGADTTGKKPDTTTARTDTSSADTARGSQPAADSPKKGEQVAQGDDGGDDDDGCMHKCVINLENLLLLLVALGGFLGNMIHVATSFTTYVGSDQYDRKWLLWYFVRPFTAAALALALYFAFRAGFMSYSSSGGNLNLYGVMAIAILSGLFTDIATLKLKEIFEVMFKPKDDRAGKLKEVKITAVTPAKLDPANANTIVITGTGLDSKKLDIKIGDSDITGATVTETSITFAYTLTAADKTKTELTMVVSEAGKAIFTNVFAV